MRKLTTEEFIEKARKVHGDKYDYSKTIYVPGKAAKTNITCLEHGEFFKRGSSHLEGRGCILCDHENRRKGLTNFIKECSELHDNKYDYSLIKEYKNSLQYIDIICPEHGVFNQQAKNHLINGCPNCKKKGMKKLKEQVKQLWGDQYSLELVKEYTNNKDKIKVICKKHGVFEKRIGELVSMYRQPSGCPECALEKIRVSKEQFIEESNDVHDNYYDYSLVEDFKHNKTKVTIVCPVHGKFRQQVLSHKRGGNCRKCFSSKGEKKILKWLEKKNIKYTHQQIFEDCRNIKPLRFDFYLPEFNTCIEYNGEQHYKVVEHWGGDEGYQQRIIHDNIKINYCDDNGIDLVIIKYDENISETLTKHFA